MMRRVIIPSYVKDGFLMRAAGIMLRLKEKYSCINKPSILFFQVTLSFPEKKKMISVIARNLGPPETNKKSTPYFLTAK